MNRKRGLPNRPARALIGGCVFALAATLAACGGSGQDEAARSKTLKVSYQLFGGTVAIDEFFKDVERQFERAHPDVTVELVPVAAEGNDYFTKLNLMRGAPATAPDVVYQDTFQINSDVEAGYLLPLDEYVADWQDWKQYEGSTDAVRSKDGTIYGVPTGTDTRALWYNKQLLRSSGVELPWRPKDWDEVLAAARAVRKAHPDAIPLNVYAGSAAGEVTSMQGLEMLLYGTDDELYDERSGRWEGATPGLIDSFDFVRTVYSEGLGPRPNDALAPNIQSAVASEMLPNGELAIALDGSWLPIDWGEHGATPWPEWEQELGVAPMPTQHGQDAGSISMSGGWSLAVSQTAPDPELAFEFVSLALNRTNSRTFAIENNQLAIRDDVAQDPKYLRTNPTIGFFSDLIDVTRFRPAFPEYPRVSNGIQTAMESVMTGESTPEQAAREYELEVRDIVGDEAVRAGEAVR